MQHDVRYDRAPQTSGTVVVNGDAGQPVVSHEQEVPRGFAAAAVAAAATPAATATTVLCRSLLAVQIEMALAGAAACQRQ